MTKNNAPKVWLLDYDHTLCLNSNRPYLALNDRINKFVQDKLKLSLPEANMLRQKFWDEFGTTLEGLRFHHGVDPDEYFDYIHQIPGEARPPHDKKLIEWLERQDCPMYIFTNARADWAVEGLHAMGVKYEDYFDHIFDIKFLGWQGKPHPHAYDKVHRHLSDKHGSDVKLWFADDALHNLKPIVEKENWVSVWINPELAPTSGENPVNVNDMYKKSNEENLAEARSVNYQFPSLIHCDIHSSN